jgi:hypothetical protein
MASNLTKMINYMMYTFTSWFHVELMSTPWLVSYHLIASCFIVEFVIITVNAMYLSVTVMHH